MLNKDDYYVKLRIAIGKEDVFFGPGTARLLELIEESGSVKEACREMELSYTKGWRILNTAEKSLGFAIVERNHGGVNGGSTSLTEDGRRLVEGFRAYESEMYRYAAESFEKFFGQ